jgi:hypothetical protein
MLGRNLDIPQTLLLHKITELLCNIQWKGNTCLVQLCSKNR